MNIKLKNVSKSYEKKVIKKLSLDLEGFNTVAIIGKSGCGKSTLLRLMTGIESFDSGNIVINNHDLGNKSIRTYQEQIGIVFQQHNLFPHLTLLQNITMILEKTRRMSSEEADEIANSLLNQLHLEDEKHKKPKFVSGGQAQRASIARALATKPEIVFMDEPTAALDPILTKEVLDAIRILKEKGTEFVFVTHEINFVRQFAEYIIFMDEGEIIEEGRIDILDNPVSEKLQLFLENERSLHAS